MKLLVSFFPSVFPTYNHGGSTKVLKDIVSYFGDKGDQVTILCNRRRDNHTDFRLHPNVLVRPIYQLRETYPNPYLTPPFYIRDMISTVHAHVREHDALLVFDSDYHFTDLLPKDYPLYFSLRDFLYAEALEGAFLIRRGELIVNSEFVRDSVLATVGQILPEIASHIHLIHNGVDTRTFKRVTPNRVLDYIPLPDDSYPILLFPHRPEDHKGFPDALNVVQSLVKRHGLSNVRLLVARGIDTNVSDEVTQYYRYLAAQVESRGIGGNVIFHDWLPQDLMPEYYSLGTATLCIGNVVEAFSNTALESLSCETPVIVSNVASHRTLFPEWCVFRNAYGDTEGVCQNVLSLVANPAIKDMRAARSLVLERFDRERMCEQYWTLLHRVPHISSAFSYGFEEPSLDDNTVLMLPPWCTVTGTGIYNDYLKSVTSCGPLAKLLSDNRDHGVALRKAIETGIDRSYLLGEVKKGNLLIGRQSD